MTTFSAIGIDAAFANMGLVRVYVDTSTATPTLRIDKMKLITTEGEKGKQVRKSSDSLRRARILWEALQDFSRSGATIGFAEVPSGAQSAAAAKALGIATGILASCPFPLIEVSPMEVKRVFDLSGKRKVTKDEIVAWAVKLWPDAGWLTHKVKGKTILNKDNEHMADALAIIMAGIATPEFKRLVALHATSSTHNDRPASGRVRLR